MLRTLHGKSIVITGAASGIGEALAHACAKRGARLLLADIDAVGLERVVAAVRKQGAECSGAVTDTGSEAAIRALAAVALERLGGSDIVINNAGVGLVAPVDKVSTDDAHWLMNINFWGVVHGCQAFLPQLRQRPDALLVNISSIFAMVSVPTQSIYNASKAAVRGFSDALREELRAESNGGPKTGSSGTTVDVLCVHPGGIKTNIVNSARLVDVSLVADNEQQIRESFTRLARTTPEQAAKVIVEAIERRKTRVLIGSDAVIMDGLFRLFPTRASHWMSLFGQWLRRHAPKGDSARKTRST